MLVILIEFEYLKIYTWEKINIAKWTGSHILVNSLALNQEQLTYGGYDNFSTKN